MQVIQVRQRKQQQYRAVVIQESYAIHNRASLSRLSKQDSAGRLIILSFVQPVCLKVIAVLLESFERPLLVPFQTGHASLDRDIQVRIVSLIRKQLLGSTFSLNFYYSFRIIHNRIFV